ncbi:MAG: helix-turn-helix domain-containing protein [Nannocystales bacterium]
MTTTTTHTPALGIRRIRGTGEAHTGHVQHYGCTLAYVLDGEAELEIGRIVRALPGSMIVLPTGTPHRGIRRKDMDAWGLSFCPSCHDLSETAWMTPFQAVRRGASPVVTIPEARRPAVQSMFEGLHDELTLATAQASELGASWLRLILGELRRAAPSGSTAGRADSLCTRALTFIEAHAFEKISLRDVATAVHCTPSHLATVMKQETSQTVGDWLAAIRVSSAANWLLHSDAPLEEIAQRVGWGDRTHFTRQFRKAYGHTPAAWRESMRHKPADPTPTPRSAADPAITTPHAAEHKP